MLTLISQSAAQHQARRAVLRGGGGKPREARQPSGSLGTKEVRLNILITLYQSFPLNTLHLIFNHVMKSDLHFFVLCFGNNAKECCTLNLEKRYGPNPTLGLFSLAYQGMTRQMDRWPEQREEAAEVKLSCNSVQTPPPNHPPTHPPHPLCPKATPYKESRG